MEEKSVAKEEELNSLTYEIITPDDILVSGSREQLYKVFEQLAVKLSGGLGYLPNRENTINVFDSSEICTYGLHFLRYRLDGKLHVGVKNARGVKEYQDEMLNAVIDLINTN